MSGLNIFPGAHTVPRNGNSPPGLQSGPRRAVLFGGAWAEQEQEAQRLVHEKGVQPMLSTDFNKAFIWHIQRWPNWLQVKIDCRNIKDGDIEKLKAWFEPLRERLQTYLSGIFRESAAFQETGELVLIPEPKKKNPGQYGGCCGNGCNACVIGSHMKKPRQPDSFHQVHKAFGKTEP